MFKDVGILGALVVCFLLGLFFKSLGGILGFFTEQSVLRVVDVGLLSLGGRARTAARSSA